MDHDDTTSTCRRCGCINTKPAGKVPFEKALDGLNPMIRIGCPRCERGYWKWKPLGPAILATILAVGITAFLVNAGAQLIMHTLGVQYDRADHGELFKNVDSGLRCPDCGSPKISHSIRQPRDWIIAPMNPMAPYRCWECWRRFWRPGGLLLICSALVCSIVLLLTFSTSVLAFRKRKLEIREWVNVSDDAEALELADIFKNDERQ